MATQNFKIDNGLQVNNNLIFAAGSSGQVGINTTNPDANVAIIGTMNVSSLSTVNTLAVTGAANLNSTLGVFGVANLASNVNISGQLTLTANLVTVDPTYVLVGSNVSINSSTAFIGNATVNTSIVGGAGFFSGNLIDSFPSGTQMIFRQTLAPTGWTKIITGNDAALRVVSGTASTGGTVGFTTAFASQAVNGTVGSHVLTTTEMPSHTHGVSDPSHNHSLFDPSHTHPGSPAGWNFRMSTPSAGTSAPDGPTSGGSSATGSSTTTGAAVTGMSIFAAFTGISIQNNGSNGGHNHTFAGTAINLAVKYIDCIIAQKA